MDNRSQILNDNEEALRLVLDGRQVGIWTALPGIIDAIDFSTMTCTVQPAIQAVVTDSLGVMSAVDLPQLLDVPIVFPKGGGFLVTMPLAVGDEVLVVFSSRCIDAWFQSGDVQQAMEARMHDLSDGFAIPGPYSLPELSGVAAVSETDLQIRNEAGTTSVSVGADGNIKLVVAGGKHVAVTGNLTVSGTIVAQGEVTGNSIPLSTHVHSGVTPGGGSTGPPV